MPRMPISSQRAIVVAPAAIGDANRGRAQIVAVVLLVRTAAVAVAEVMKTLNPHNATPSPQEVIGPPLTRSDLCLWCLVFCDQRKSASEIERIPERI